jgi:hypothetical protein
VTSAKFKRWLERKADVFIEAFAKSAGEQTGKFVVPIVAVEIMQCLRVDLVAPVDELLHRIFKVLHLLF